MLYPIKNKTLLSCANKKYRQAFVTFRYLLETFRLNNQFYNIIRSNA